MSGPRRREAACPRPSSSTGPFQSTASCSSPRSTSHGLPDAGRSARLDPPAARHAQVAAEHEPALETEEEVLPDGLDRLEQAPVETLRELLPGGPRMRRLDLDSLSGEHLEPTGRPVERVSLWHAPRLGLRIPV